MPWVCLQFVIVVFLDHTDYLFYSICLILVNHTEDSENQSKLSISHALTMQYCTCASSIKSNNRRDSNKDLHNNTIGKFCSKLNLPIVNNSGRDSKICTIIYVVGNVCYKPNIHFVNDSRRDSNKDLHNNTVDKSTIN